MINNFVLDATNHPNSNTHQPSSYCPLEVSATHLDSAFDSMYSYAHVILVDEVTEVTGLETGGNFCAFIRSIYGIKGLLKTFTQMSIFFKHLIHQGPALVYFDDIPLMSYSKPHTATHQTIL